jgi:hypothetical protein
MRSRGHVTHFFAFHASSNGISKCHIKQLARTPNTLAGVLPATSHSLARQHKPLMLLSRFIACDSLRSVSRVKRSRHTLRTTVQPPMLPRLRCFLFRSQSLPLSINEQLAQLKTCIRRCPSPT